MLQIIKVIVPPHQGASEQKLRLLATSMRQPKSSTTIGNAFRVAVAAHRGTSIVRIV
jgi:hypothetical protein